MRINGRPDHNSYEIDYDNEPSDEDLGFCSEIFAAKTDTENTIIKERDYLKKGDRFRQIMDNNTISNKMSYERQNMNDKINEKMRNYIEKVDSLRQKEIIRSLAYLGFDDDNVEPKAARQYKENLEKRKRGLYEQEIRIESDKIDYSLLMQKKLKEESEAAMRKFVETRIQILDQEKTRVRQKSQEHHDSHPKEKYERKDRIHSDKYDTNLAKNHYTSHIGPSIGNSSYDDSKPQIFGEDELDESQENDRFQSNKYIRNNHELITLKDDFQIKNIERSQGVLEKNRSRKGWEEHNQKIENLHSSQDKGKSRIVSQYIDSKLSVASKQSKDMNVIKEKPFIEELDSSKCIVSLQKNNFIVNIDREGQNSYYYYDDDNSNASIPRNAYESKENSKLLNNTRMNEKKAETLDNFYPRTKPYQESQGSIQRKLSKKDINDSMNNLRSRIRSYSGTQMRNYDNESYSDLMDERQESHTQENRPKSRQDYHSKIYSIDESKGFNAQSEIRNSKRNPNLSDGPEISNVPSQGIVSNLALRAYNTYTQGFYQPNSKEIFSKIQTNLAGSSIQYPQYATKYGPNSEYVAGSIYPNQASVLYPNETSAPYYSASGAKIIPQLHQGFAIHQNPITISSPKAFYDTSNNISNGFLGTGAIISQKDSIKNYGLISQSKMGTHSQYELFNNKNGFGKLGMEILDPEKIEIKNYIKEQEEYLAKLEIERQYLEEKRNIRRAKTDNLVNSALGNHSHNMDFSKEQIKKTNNYHNTDDLDENSSIGISKERFSQPQNNRWLDKNKSYQNDSNSYDEEADPKEKINATRPKKYHNSNIENYDTKIDDIKQHTDKLLGKYMKPARDVSTTDKNEEYDTKIRYPNSNMDIPKRLEPKVNNYVEESEGDPSLSNRDIGLYENRSLAKKKSYENLSQNEDYNRKTQDMQAIWSRKLVSDSNNTISSGFQSKNDLHSKKLDEKSINDASIEVNEQSLPKRYLKTQISSKELNYGSNDKEKKIIDLIGEVQSTKARSCSEVADPTRNFMEFSFKNQPLSSNAVKSHTEFRNKQNSNKNVQQEPAIEKKKAWKMEFNITDRNHSTANNGKHESQANLSLAEMFKRNKKNFIEKYEQQKTNQQLRNEFEKQERYRTRTKEEILQQRKEMMEYKRPHSRSRNYGSETRARSESRKSEKYSQDECRSKNNKSKEPNPELLERLALGIKSKVKVVLYYNNILKI